MKNIVELKNVTTKFGNRTIHDKVSITIQEKDIYAIIGKSGTGKSTLIRAILMLQPFIGSIKVFGQELCNANEFTKNSIKKQYGVMFQAASLFTSLTVGENISVPLKEDVSLPNSLIEEIAKFKLSLVGLDENAYYLYPSELSGGMRKKAALARALVLDPKLLFLDEPTSGLDPVSAEDFDNTIRNLNKLLGITVIMITHDLDSFFNISTKACILGDKKVLAEGKPSDIINLDNDWIKKVFFGERGRKFTKWNQKPISHL